MLYEFIKAWRATRDPFDEVILYFFFQWFLNHCISKIAEPMPHYLRMLTYAREPDTEWGPAKNENRSGRYKPTIENSTGIDQLNLTDHDNDSMFDSENVLRVRF